jgi:2-amino-4-hydroxy-6-hydroxymethyldihydropteridine diphosphokinase
MTIQCFIGLGSNLNNPKMQIEMAINKMRAWENTKVIGISSLYESKPMGDKSQANYLNCVVCLETTVAPLSLLAKCQEIESLQHRNRDTQQKWQARTIDCDVLLYGDEVIEMTGLCVPHPGLSQRDFVLQPLLEIAPDLILPNGKSIPETLAQLSMHFVIQPTPEVVGIAEECP